MLFRRQVDPFEVGGLTIPGIEPGRGRSRTMPSLSAPPLIESVHGAAKISLLPA